MTPAPWRLAAVTPPITGDNWAGAVLVDSGICRDCRAAGLTLRSAFDCLIAAHAIRLDLPLLASDRDFAAIASRHPLALFIPKETP